MPIYRDPQEIEVLNRVDVNDLDQRQLLIEILKELQKANEFLEIIESKV